MVLISKKFNVFSRQEELPIQNHQVKCQWPTCFVLNCVFTNLMPGRLLGKFGKIIFCCTTYLAVRCSPSSETLKTVQRFLLKENAVPYNKKVQ